MQYKILSKHFGYSNPNEYIWYYRCENVKTNRDIFDVYEAYKCKADVDLILILEIDDDIFELNEKLNYGIFKKDEEIYTLLICVTTEKEYNEYLKSYSGDFSKLFLAEIVYDELSNK